MGLKKYIEELTSDTVNVDSLISETIHFQRVRSRVGQSSIQTFSNETFERVQYDSISEEDSFNTGGWNTTNYEFIVPEDGDYYISARVTFTSVPNGTTLFGRVVNSGNQVEKERESFNTSGGNATIQVSTVIRATQGDNLYLEMFQDSGGTLDTITGIADTNITINKVA